MLLKNDHTRRRALFFILAHLPFLAPLCPAPQPLCLLLHFTCLSAEFSLLQNLGDSWHLNRISDLGALCPAAKIRPLCQHLATHLREARTLTDAAVLQKDKCYSSRPSLR